MPTHPALKEGNVAVITGGADGIGLAAAKHCRSLGMQVCIADISEEKLAAAEAEVDGALAVVTDVSRREDLEKLRDAAYSAFGQVDVLMNNAGVGLPNTPWTEYEAWETILGVNLWGVINGLHAFTQAMIDQGTPGAIINTGSKQGITTPPGNPAYNVSKSGVKSATEALAHSLRNTENCEISAHLLVPGFTYTGMIRKFLPEQPPAAWSPEQVVEYLVTAMGNGDFYVLCPDNEVDRETDNKRMAWAMGDLIENRPALSRWHPDYESAFARFMED